MTDKKLNDNKTFNPCDECQHSFSKNNQESNVCKICEFKQSQDLIDRQKAENDRLNIELKAMRGAANSYKAEIERLKKDKDLLGESSPEQKQNWKESMMRTFLGGI